MSNVKEFLYREQFTTATEAMDFLNRSIATSVDYDAFGNKKVFTAVVLSMPIMLAHADTTSKSMSHYSAGRTISRFAFKARILDDPSPHWYLPDPCRISSAKKPKKQLNRIFLHTTFISRSDYDLNYNDVPKIGDRVFVRLEKNIFSYKLDFGEFVEIDATSNIDDVSAGGGIAGADYCSSIDSLFGGASTTTVAKAYSVVKPTATTTTPTAKAVVSSPGKAPFGEKKKTMAVKSTFFTDPIPPEYTRVFFGDSQIEGAFGSQLENLLGPAAGQRYGKHSTQPKAWLRCIGTGKCTDPKADVTKVKNMWAALEKKPKLIIISLGGNGVDGLDTLISELKATFTRLSYEPYIIWQGPPPPVHKDVTQALTKYYGKIKTYNSGYTARNARGQTVKAAVLAAGWDFVDPYEYLKLAQDTSISGYGCKGCDGVHLDKNAAAILIAKAYWLRFLHKKWPPFDKGMSDKSPMRAQIDAAISAGTGLDPAVVATWKAGRGLEAGIVPKGMK